MLESVLEGWGKRTSVLRRRKYSWVCENHCSGLLFPERIDAWAMVR